MSKNDAPVPSGTQQSLGIRFYECGTAGEFLDQLAGKSASSTEKGEALEELFRYVAVRDPALQVKSVARWKDWCRSEAAGGRFHPQDKGIDLVAEIDDGSFVAVQCKHYAKHRVSLSAASTFLSALAKGGGTNGKPFFAQGWLVSTTQASDNLVLEMHEHIVQCRVMYWAQWADMPISTAYRYEKKDLRDYQEKAIKKIQSDFEGAVERGKLIMACGTGKTLTALRLVEALANSAAKRRGGRDAFRVLLCAPTISLVSQTRTEWLRETRKRLDMRAVCSDKGAGRALREVERLLAVQELQCPVTTASSEIAKFLQAPPSGGAIRVVVATYQSLPKIAEAMADDRVPPFDLAIADEAHVTAGSRKVAGKSKDSAFRMIHDASLVRARKRLYMTATPRIYSNAQALRTRGYDIADMDNTDTFGHTLHRYDFAEALGAGYLSNYRVVCLGVHAETLSKGLRKRMRGERDVKRPVDAGGDNPKFDPAVILQLFKQGKITPKDETRLFGTMLALRGNFKDEEGQYPGALHRTLAFANTIPRSRWFAEMINDDLFKRELTRNEKSFRETEGNGAAHASPVSTKAEHLDSNDHVQERMRALGELKAAGDKNQVRVLGNVRIFSEGVDVPALNAVAFLDPRKSHIDVVQAVGRVMRKAEGKDCGYVIVPIFVPEGSTLKETKELAPDEFEPLLKVIAALKAHDTDMERDFRSKLVIIEARRKKRNGQGNGGAPPDDSEGVENGEQIELEFDIPEEERDAIRAHLVIDMDFTRRSKSREVAHEIKERVAVQARRMEQAEFGPEVGPVVGAGFNEKAGKHGWQEACTLASLLLLNAMLVHRRMRDTGNLDGLKSLDEVLADAEPDCELEKSWRLILRKDYTPIFEPARRVLSRLGEYSADLCRSVMTGLIDCALQYGPRLADLGWDHSGHLYHSVLGTAKSDGAFYTNNISAMMLARLAIADSMANWSDPRSIAKLRIMDPACGTGTLLLAALQELKRRALLADPNADIEALHKELVERSLCGLDINIHATQLAASNLTIHAEGVDYDRMHVYTMKRGVQGDGQARLGSIEILDTAQEGGHREHLFQHDRSLAALGAERSTGGSPDAGLDGFCSGNLDLVIMNPPFTNAEHRDRHLDDDARKIVKKREKEIERLLEERDPSLKGVVHYNSIRTFFTPLADTLLDTGHGTMATVNPATACCGASGLQERIWIARHWHLERVVCNHDAKNYAFSEYAHPHFTGPAHIKEQPIYRRRCLDVKWRTIRHKIGSAACALSIPNIRLVDLSSDEN